MKKYLLITAVFSVLLAGTALAKTMVGPNSEVRLAGDRYLTGEAVQVTDTVNGDVVAIGDTVNISGAISGDLMVLARSVTVDGDVTGSIRGAAETININGSVGQKVMVAGMQVHLNAGQSATANTVVAAGSEVIIDRPLTGYAYLCAQSATFNYPVDGPVRLVNTAVTLGSGATMPSGVTYQKMNSSTANDESINKLRAITQVSVVDSTYDHPAPVMSYGASVVTSIEAAIAFIILGLLAIWLVPAQLSEVAEAERQNGWLVVLFGILGLPIYLVIAIALLFTVILTPVGVLMLLLAPVLFILAYLGFLVNVGRLIAQRTKRDLAPLNLLVLGTAVMFVLNLIPLLGFLAGLAAYLICSGVWWVLFLRKVRAIK